MRRAPWRRRVVVELLLLARKVAAIRDATARIRDVLPESADALAADRTAREVVVLNLMVAVQEAIDLATHWVADAGWLVPEAYRDLFVALAEHGIIDADLAVRLAAAAGLRNLIAHRYGALDWRRIHEIASGELGDLEDFCAAVAEAADAP